MKKNYIPLCMLFGIALGNSIGLVIGYTFFMENIGIGLLIGNAIGILSLKVKTNADGSPTHSPI